MFEPAKIGSGRYVMRVPTLLVVAASFLSACAPARADTLARRLASGMPVVCAHRGWLSPSQPENDLSVFRHTAATGPFMLEMDLAETRDRAIVLMHDASVDRTTDGHGTVAAMDAAAIEKLHLRARAAPAGTDAPPRLASVLDWAARTPSALLMLDIKQTPPAAVMEEVRRAGVSSRVVLLTFDAETAARAFAADPSVLVSVLVTDTAALDRYRAAAGADRRFAAYVPAGSAPSLFEAAHRAGAVVITDLLDRRDALAPGADVSVLAGRHADIVVSNRPEQTLRALRQSYPP